MKFIIRRYWDILLFVACVWISAGIMAYNLYSGLYAVVAGGM